MTNKKRAPKSTEINLEDMDEHFQDLDSLASALNNALQDADKVLSKGRTSEEGTPETAPAQTDPSDNETQILSGEETIPIEIDESIDVMEKLGEEMVAENTGDSEVIEIEEAEIEVAPEVEEVVVEEPESEVVQEAKPVEEEPKKESPAPMGLADLPDEEQEEDDPQEDSKSGSAREEELYERLLRNMADFENYKKRVNRDKEDLRRFANEDIIMQLLPVMDNFERAITHVKESKDIRALLEGVNMIFRQIREILKKYGVRSFESIGKPFDPTKHQAVSLRETAETLPNTILEEFQRGYFLHDRLIRPAMVVVSSAAEGESGKKESESAQAEEVVEELEELSPLEAEDEADGADTEAVDSQQEDDSDQEGELEELEPIS